MPHESKNRDAGRLVGSDRVLAVLVELGRHPDGATLDELASSLASPKSTVHRALASLRRASFAELTSRGVYALGDEFFRLAFSNYESRPETVHLEPLLRSLSDQYGETVHYAVLEGKDVVYRAKQDPPQGAVRLTSTVGGRNPAYRTAVGKLLLSYRVRNEAELQSWLAGEVLEARTAHTIADPRALLAELQSTRERGYGVDDQENELGINCVAVPAFVDREGMPKGAISVSALRFRYPIDRLVETVDELSAKVRSVLSL
jgi:IclR family acetate operon transcriptional repressor